MHEFWSRQRQFNQNEGNKTGPSLESRKQASRNKKRTKRKRTQKEVSESLSFQTVPHLSINPATAKKVLEGSADTSLSMILKMFFEYPQCT